MLSTPLLLAARTGDSRVASGRPAQAPHPHARQALATNRRSGCPWPLAFHVQKRAVFRRGSRPGSKRVLQPLSPGAPPYRRGASPKFGILRSAHSHRRSKRHPEKGTASRRTFPLHQDGLSIERARRQALKTGGTQHRSRPGRSERRTLARKVDTRVNRLHRPLRSEAWEPHRELPGESVSRSLSCERNRNLSASPAKAAGP